MLVFFVIAVSSCSAAGEEAAVATFWQRPTPVHPSFSPKDLQPRSCGACHIDKLKDWSASLHSRSMGPGLLFQLDPLLDPDTAVACYYCHAPLSLQSEVSVETPAGTFHENKDYDEKLKLTGVSCAVCHVRGDSVSGPLLAQLKGLKEGVTSTHKTREEGFFEDAEFCAACHQLENGFRINGKLIVNTYAEWKKSAFGSLGVVCQSCHMPGRRHLFRGIHDPAMTRSGVEINVTPTVSTRGLRAVRLTITNLVTGHYYPTYATPLIVVKGYLADKKGRLLKGTEKEAYIGRKLALDLSREYFDTRIAPSKSFVFEYPIAKTTKANGLVFEVRVYPDEFYNRFYEYYLGKEKRPKIRKQIEAAHDKSSSSGYELFRKELVLKDIDF